MTRKTEKFIDGLIALSLLENRAVGRDISARDLYRNLKAHGLEWTGQKWAAPDKPPSYPWTANTVTIRVTGYISDVEQVVNWLSRILADQPDISTIETSRLIQDEGSKGRQYINTTPMDLPF